MSRKMKNLLAEKAAKMSAVQAIIDNPASTKEEVAAVQAELSTINAKIEAQAAIDAGIKFDENGIEITAAGAASPTAPKDSKAEAVKAFAAAARQRFQNVMTEGTDGDGGYIVPEDIQTQVNQYRQAVATLRNMVTVEKVTTNKGRRIFQTAATQTGFALVGENGKVTAKAAPTFTPLSFDIDKYAGYIPVTNELMSDSDTVLTDTLAKWLGGEANATDNANILAILQGKVAVDLTDIDGIKSALITTLGSAYMATSIILTNDSGLLYLSTLYDGVGHPLLKADPARPGKLALEVGPYSVPVESIPDAILANDTTKVPFIVGDLKEAVALFDREQISIATSDSATVGTGESQINAFEQGVTLFKGTVREDVLARDTNAWVEGYITVT